MSRWGASLALASVLALGCDASSTADAGIDGGADAGPSCTVLSYDPASGALDRWPEPRLLVDDATTETGARLHFEEATYSVLTNQLRGYRAVFTEDLAELDGFGVTAEAYFSFGRAFDAAALPSGDATERADAGLGLVVIAPGEPRLWPVIVDVTDEGRTILMAPLRPLPAKAEVAAFVTRALTDAAGGCLEPSVSMQDELSSPDTRTAAAIEALTGLGVVDAPTELVALSAYLTQSIEEDTIAVAADIAGRAAPTFVAAPTCTDEALFRRCEARVVLSDYRDEDGVFRRAGGTLAEPQRTYEVPLSIWLPLEGQSPYPTLFYGHGLSGDRGQGGRLASFAAPAGMATVAATALMHGDHPTNPDPDGDALSVVLGFFAIGDLGERAVHATRLRDHFRQTTWDRLQITRLLEASPDVDGDGAADLDGARLAYLGVSLGGLMGPELLAATDAYGAGVLVVPGGRVSTIISDSAMFSSIIELLRPRGTTEGDVRRFFPILQTVLDAGDPAAYGAHTLRDRFASAPEAPDVLVGVVLDDEVVPNIANYALGRALGVPIVEPLLREELGFEVVTGPIANNVDGVATAGLLQFDLVRDDGEVVTATHNNIGDSDVGAAAWFDFLTSHLDGEAVIEDPYAAIDFPRP